MDLTAIFLYDVQYRFIIDRLVCRFRYADVIFDVDIWVLDDEQMPVHRYGVHCLRIDVLVRQTPYNIPVLVEVR